MDVIESHNSLLNVGLRVGFKILTIFFLVLTAYHYRSIFCGEDVVTASAFKPAVEFGLQIDPEEFDFGLGKIMSGLFCDNIIPLIGIFWLAILR